MRIILTAASLALLAACGGAATGNEADNAAGNAAAAPAENAAAPAENAAAPAATAGGAGDARRANEIGECAGDVRGELPAGTDVDAFCGCAVDRMAQGGAGEREAMEQCATQMGIEPRR
jgi:hypothetical protein